METYENCAVTHNLCTSFVMETTTGIITFDLTYWKSIIPTWKARRMAQIGKLCKVYTFKLFYCQLKTEGWIGNFHVTVWNMYIVSQWAFVKLIWILHGYFKAGNVLLTHSVIFVRWILAQFFIAAGRYSSVTGMFTEAISFSNSVT